MKSGTQGDLSGSVDLRSLGLDGRKLAPLLLVSGLIAVGLAWAAGTREERGAAHFSYAYLLSFCYFVSFSLGALFFVLVQHLTRAGWSVVIRRLAEILAAALPYAGLLFVPIAVALLLGSSALYEWNDPQLLAHDAALAKKAAYLNAPFFVIRSVFYFAVWGSLAWYFFRQSTRQDATGDPRLTLCLQRWSAPGMMAFAITVCFASFDWLMSLDPHWVSTIFGVYFFAGCVVGIFALLVILVSLAQQRGAFERTVTVEHYHDLGKQLFGYVFFWGYIAFSQYLLIWYANLPEETCWLVVRQSHGWQWIGLLLLFGHLLLPFLGLLSRHVRRNRAWLTGWAAFLLVMHWVDLYWLVMPVFDERRLTFGWVDVLCLVGVGSLYLAAVVHVATGPSLVPTRDPRLNESLAFHNV
jgi:hypothetical protein